MHGSPYSRRVVSLCRSSIEEDKRKRLERLKLPTRGTLNPRQKTRSILPLRTWSAQSSC